MADQLQRLFSKIPEIPLCFLGVGVYRVWTETVYTNTSIVFPAQEIGSFEMFNIVSIVCLLLLVLFSRRIAPLCKLPGVFPITGFLMSASALLNFCSIIYPEYSNILAWPSVLGGGIGISLIMMLWSEFYGCLNPFRVGLYYSASIILGAMILWVFKGLAFWWICIGAALMPILSLACLKRSLSLLPINERPHPSWGYFTFPWKPILLVALYAFAYGLRESIFYSSALGPHSSPGVVFPSLLIFLGISLFPEKFKFSIIWKLALAMMLVSLVPLSLIMPFGRQLSDFCALTSYTSCLVLIMVILSNLSYRYGVCALWLFGIERAVRLGAVLLGLKTSALIQGNITSGPDHIVIYAAVFAAVMIPTFIFLSEKQLSSPWGVVLSRPPKKEEALSEKNRLGTKCNELAKQFSLSQREEEVLLLLAQRKKSSDIERELFIARSTVKTHLKHIYQKLEIHSRRELYELLGIGK